MFGLLRRGLGLAWWYLSEATLWLFGRRQPYAILKLDISGDLAEGQSSSPLSFLRNRPRTDYLHLLATLRWARDDSQLKAVFVRCHNLHLGWARVQEIHRSLSALRAAGKQVWVQLTQAGIHEYVLASAADRILLTPAGGLDITGLSSEVTFFAGALEKLGIQPEVVQLGKYKSAGEAFTRSSMSEAHREMIESLVGDLYQQVIELVAAGRGLEPAQVRERLDRGPFSGAEAVEHKLVDGLQYDDETEEALGAACDKASAVEQPAYAARRTKVLRRDALRRRLGRVGVVHVVGTIKMGDSLPGMDGSSAAGAETLLKDLQDLRERDDIRAVVLRVVSPGGSGLASDLLWHELQRIRRRKPLVVSFGDVAASGGYYIGVAGSPVLAEAGTITGSIGVLAGKPVLRGLYDHLGLTKEIVSQGRHAALHSDYLPLGTEERQLLQRHAQTFYTDFVDKVANGRVMPHDQVDAVAQGRVWTGRQAKDLGLVDQIGGIEDAVAEAKLLAGFRRDELVAIDTYPRPKRLWRLPAIFPFQNRAAAWQPLLSSLSRERVWALLPIRLRFF